MWGIGKPAVPVILQSGQTDCGLAALAMVASGLGHATDVGNLRQRYHKLDSGPSLRTILTLSSALGLVATPLRVASDDLLRVQLPAILHWRFEHFVVLTRLKSSVAVIHDPAVGRRKVSLAELGDAFTGVAIEFTRAVGFETKNASAVARVWPLIRSLPGLTRYFSAMALLMLGAQLLALAPPVATQLLIDDVVLARDRVWLYRILGGIGLVMLATLVIDTMRKRIALYTGTRLALDATSSIVQHVFRLPLAALKPRSVGDTMSRVDSLRPIRTALAQTSIDTAVQLSVAATTWGLMLAYSVPLTLIASMALLLLVGVQGLLMPATRTQSQQALLANARASQSLIESLRAITTLKSLGLEGQRHAHWRQAYAEATNAAARQAGIGIGAGALAGVVGMAEQLLFLGVGLQGVIDKQVTLGMLFAFIALRGRFSAAVAQLLADWRDLYLLRPHLDRVADLLSAGALPDVPAAAMRESMSGAISCDALHFRYAGRPAILENFSCAIKAGEMVVICGPSGIGKSTLLGLLGGLLRADAGFVRYDGIDVDLWDPMYLRKQLCIVMQQERLFQGSIADNISGFDASPDFALLRDAAMHAAIWDDLQKLPMNVRTPVATGGEGLSGGQQQRIILARALYRQPRLLLLDEATSNLDLATETRVLENIRALGMTIICATHSMNAMALSDRRLELHGHGQA